MPLGNKFSFDYYVLKPWELRDKKVKKKGACVIHALLNNVTETHSYSFEDTLNKNILYIFKWTWKLDATLLNVIINEVSQIQKHKSLSFCYMKKLN